MLGSHLEEEASSSESDSDSESSRLEQKEGWLSLAQLLGSEAQRKRRKRKPRIRRRTWAEYVAVNVMVIYKAMKTHVPEEEER